MPVGEHRALAGSEFGKREGGCGQRRRAVALPGGGPLGPGCVLGQQAGQDLIQSLGCIVALKPQDDLLVNLEVGQLHPHGRQPLLPGQDRRIHLSLGPVLRCAVGGDLGRG